MINAIAVYLFIIGLFMAWQAMAVNYILAFAIMFSLAIVASVKAIEHYGKDSAYRVTSNKYLWFELSAVFVVTSVSILATGHILLGGN